MDRNKHKTSEHMTEGQQVTAPTKNWRFSASQTHLWLIKVWFYASTFLVKIATFAKPQTACELNQANRKVGKNAVKQMEGTKKRLLLCGVRANRMADKLGESK